MFLPNSRYYRQKTTRVTLPDGRVVEAVTHRRAPKVDGTPASLGASNRLDIMAFERYGDATRFWRIADANTALSAEQLSADPLTPIEVPEN